MQFNLILPVLIAYNAVSQCSSDCGKAYFSPTNIGSAGTTQHRQFVRPIVGGQSAAPHSWPWQTAVYQAVTGWYGPTTELICGGSIINDQWILSAAHCFSSNSDTAQYQITLGKQYIEETEGTQVNFGVKRIIIHENYNCGGCLQAENDIALIQLDRSVSFNNYMSPVCLPTEDQTVDVDASGVVTGWGRTQESDSSSTSNSLQQAVLPVINITTCQADYPNKINPTSMICAGFQAGGHDACQGDSGGPFVFHVSGSWVQMGIVSWGIGCARANQPGVYTNVAQYRTWIESKLIS